MRQLLNRVRFLEEAVTTQFEHFRGLTVDAVATGKQYNHPRVDLFHGGVGVIAAESRHDHVEDDQRNVLLMPLIEGKSFVAVAGSQNGVAQKMQ